MQRSFAVKAHQPDEPSLIAAARAGERSAYEQLYRLHVGRIHAVIVRLVGVREVAEDLTQDAFVRAWQLLKEFRQDSGFGTWLHRIAVNAALDHLRAQKRWGSEILDSEASALVRDSDLRLDLARAIEMLPDRMRAVFVLHDVEGLDHAEISQRLDVAEGTCRAQLFQARRILRELLGGERP
ncbi:MAG: sigma-70 family RNA polymerase sigma factor [Acidobacteriota bacterium]